jgi:phage baseplate assembly protein W
MPVQPTTPNGLDGWRREVMRVVLAMSTAAGTVYTSVRSALSDHESRIGLLESRQTQAEQKFVPRGEADAHWSAITNQLNRIEQDIRDLRFEQRAPTNPR